MTHPRRRHVIDYPSPISVLPDAGAWLLVIAVVAAGRSVADMLRVAGSVEIVQGPRVADIRLTCGRVAIAVTSSPFENAPWMNCFVVLGDGATAAARSSEPAGSPGDLGTESDVVMIVTCLQLPDVPGKRIVNLVYAIDWFRHERQSDDASVTAAVAVGRWLFETGGLTHHSEERSDADDRWARAVGGPLPERGTRSGSYDSAGSGAAIVSMLSAIPWPMPS